MSAEKIQMFNFSQVNWAPEVQALTFKSKYIRVDRNFFDFLLEDGIYIHAKYLKSAIKATSTQQAPQASEAAATDSNNESSNSSITFREFSSEFESAFASALEDFDGSLFVKLAWRAPRDTENWLHGLEITNMEDFLTALKSSGILTDILEGYETLFDIPNPTPTPNATITLSAQGYEDINTISTVQQSQEHLPASPSEQTADEALQNTVTTSLDRGLYVILKKHYTVHKHLVVRCFVRSNQLVGMCQRHCSSVNHTLSENAAEFTQLITNFFESKLRPYFPSQIGGQISLEGSIDYVFDVYLAGQKPKYRVKLIDINPWRMHTNPLLFDWDSLEATTIITQSPSGIVDSNNQNEEDMDAAMMNKESKKEQKEQKMLLKTVKNEDEAIIEDLSAYRVPEEMFFDEDKDSNADDDDQTDASQMEAQLLKEGKLAQLFDYLNTHNPDLYQN